MRRPTAAPTAPTFISWDNLLARAVDKARISKQLTKQKASTGWGQVLNID